MYKRVCSIFLFKALMALVRPCERFLVILKRPLLSKSTYSYSATERESAGGRTLPKVTLYSKPTGCSLCVVAKKALTPYSSRVCEQSAPDLLLFIFISVCVYSFNAKRTIVRPQHVYK